MLVSLGSNVNAVAVDAAVKSFILPENAHELESGKWLITSLKPTSKEVSDGLNIADITTYIIAPIRGYYGRAKPDIWEWLAAKSKNSNG